MFPTHLFGKCRRNFVAVDVSQGWVNNWEWTEMWSCFWGTKIRNCRQNTKRKGKDQRQDFLFQELLQFFRTVQHRVEYWSLSYSFPLRFYTVVSSLWKSDSVQSYVRVGVLREWRAYSFFSHTYLFFNHFYQRFSLLSRDCPRALGALVLSQRNMHCCFFWPEHSFLSLCSCSTEITWL